MDFQLVVREARELGAEHMLLFGLCLARNLLGVVLKEEIAQRIHTLPKLSMLAVETEELLFRDAVDDRHPDLFKGARFHSGMRERRRDTLFLYYALYRRILGKIILPKKADRVMLPLPQYLSFLYYLLRPIRLGGKYVLRLLKYLKR